MHFGNTEEHLRLISLGCKPIGNPTTDPHFNHVTGKGWVRGRPGDYTDALANKHNQVTVALVEASGAISPPLRSALITRHKSTRRKHASDRTSYSTHPANSKSHMRHHATRMSSAVVRAHALNTLTECSATKAAVINPTPAHMA